MTKDRSPKSSFDFPIISLLNKLNAGELYQSTSSCSGRLALFLTPPQNKSVRLGKWLHVSHDAESGLCETIKSTLRDFSAPLDSHFRNFVLYYKFEPFILHVTAKDLDSASYLCRAAVDCGFRESGITFGCEKKITVAIRCSIKLDIPLAVVTEAEDRLKLSFFMSDWEVYVESIHLILESKFQQNEKRWKRLEQWITENES